MSYSKNTLYITGTSRIGTSDPIADTHELFFVGIVLERENGIIIDVTCNMVKDLTVDFIRSVLIGYSLTHDFDALESEMKDRFHGLSQKSVIAALKDARNKYSMISRDKV